MAKEKQKMTLNVRKRAGSTSNAPPAIDSAKIEAFASGAENVPKREVPKVSEQRVVRDAFTMPADDHALFAEIQSKCLPLGIVVTKSEILRAGLKHLVALDGKNLEKVIKSVPKVKTGRPTDKSRIKS